MKSLFKRITWLLILSLSLVSPLSFAIPQPLTNKSELKAITVYVTKTGKKYHLNDCSYLRLSKITIDKDIAIKEGYTACSRCKP